MKVDMRNNKGITLLSLIGYVILSLMALAVLGVITSNFRKNFDELNVQSVQEVELDKINLQLTKEIKEGNTVNKSQTSTYVLTFTNGTVYTYVPEDKAIYQNNNILIAKHIKNCIFATIGDNMLRVFLEVENNSRAISYTVRIAEI